MVGVPHPEIAMASCVTRRAALALAVALVACADSSSGDTDTGGLDSDTHDAISGDATDAAPTDAADASDADVRSSDQHPLCARVEGLCAPLADGRVGDPHVVAPSDALPQEFVSQGAHNNLDATWHDDRLYLAIRTAPTHFASPHTVMYVVSSPDLTTWRYEGEVAMGTDVREPQLVSWDGRLWLYWAVLGDNPFDFEPQGVRRMEYQEPGVWSEPVDAFEDGLIPWRIKPMEIDGEERLHMVGYTGGENVYDNGEEGLATYWLVSDDGDTWDSYLDDPIVRVSGASETDLVLRDDGRLVAVARNEAGDETGYGSHICSAPADDLSAWTCESDRRKYDSPLMVWEDGQAWLIGRRNVTDTGNYDLERDDLEPSERYLQYQVAYWSTPKRCSVWRVDGDALAVTHAFDLPSRGDTCFPEAIPLGDGLHLVFNYSSPFEGDDLTWQVAQGRETWVYWVVVDLSAD